MKRAIDNISHLDGPDEASDDESGNQISGNVSCLQYVTDLDKLRSEFPFLFISFLSLDS